MRRSPPPRQRRNAWPRLRPLPWLGLIALTAGVMFYGALAMDPRSPRVWMEGAIQLALEDSLPASILLALAYGAMNAALASNVVLRFGQTARPWKVGLLCGSALLALLAVAAGAIARGGRLLLGQAMPTVILGRLLDLGSIQLPLRGNHAGRCGGRPD